MNFHQRIYFINMLMEEIVDKAPESFKNHSLIKEYVEVARENMQKMND